MRHALFLVDKVHPVTQTRSGFPAGNCTEASLASLLGCSLDDVPQLWCGSYNVATDAEAQPADRFAALFAWLRDEWGLVWLEWELGGEVPLPVKPEVYAGLLGSMVPKAHKLHFLVGPNSDGVSHMTVGRHGAVLWDPNPTRRGLRAVTHIGGLFPTEIHR